MYKNWTGKQILIAVLVIILILWFIGRIMGVGTTQTQTVKSQVQQRPPVIVQPVVQPVVQQPVVQQPVAQAPVMTGLPGSDPRTWSPTTNSPSMARPGSDPRTWSPTSDSQNTPFTLYNFYSPKCPACRNFANNWDRSVDGLKKLGGLSIHAKDVTKPENENLAFYYNVTRLPTVILVTPDKNIEYNGDRSVEDLQNFVVSNMIGDMEQQLGQ